MRVAGVFAGIGGFEVGLESVGHRTVLLCDIDPAARRVLEARFDCRVDGDVRDIELSPRIDLVTAGFPCQDLSQVGTTKGMSGSKSSAVKHLFSMLRKRRVPWVLIENVPFMLHLDRGHAMEYLVKNLEDLGYDWAYRTIDSLAYGLPQRRRRVFLLASRDHDPREILLSDNKTQPLEQRYRINGEACGFYWTEGNRGLGWAVDATPPLKGGSGWGIVSTPAIVLPSRSIVLPDIRDGERLQGFRANWTKPASQKGSRQGERWRLVGNAVNVKVSKWLGERFVRSKPYNCTADVPLKRSDRWPASAWGVGGRRARSAASTWPVRRSAPPLAEFLKYPQAPLSKRATRGFLNRLLKSRLIVDEGFIKDLKRHLLKMD